MSTAKRAAEVKLTTEGAEATTARAGDALGQLERADERLEAAAGSLNEFVSKAKDLANRFGGL